MQPNTIVRVKPYGPDGKLNRIDRPFPAEWMATEQPVKHGYRYIDDVQTGIWVGVWEATPFTMAPHLYSANEFMLVLEGSVTMVESSGGETTIRAGESLVVPHGWDGYWKQTEPFRKFSFGFVDALWKEPANRDSLRIIKPDHQGKLDDLPALPTDSLLTAAAVQHARVWFTDVTSQFSVGIRDTAPCRRKASASARHEWVHVLQGLVFLTDAAGQSYRFDAGDTFLVPLGAVCDWTCNEYLRTLYCTFQPSAETAKA